MRIYPLLLAALFAPTLLWAGPSASGLKTLSTPIQTKQKPAMAAPVPATAAVNAPDYKDSIDLSGQFTTTPRGQGKIGSCHTFASVGLVEAAYYRHYGTHADLAEHDLFTQTKICTGEVCDMASVYTALDGSRRCGLGEGGHVGPDIEYILQNGILPDGGTACRTYDEFAETYTTIFQKRLKDAMLKLDAKGKELPEVAPGKLDRMAQRYMCPAGNAEELRAAVKSELAGFRPKSRRFHSFYSPAELLSLAYQKCAAEGQEQRRALLEALNKGLPVAVSVQLLGLKDWRMETPPPTSNPSSTGCHAFMITGYSTKNGRLVFHTRNSWVKDGKQINPDMKSSQLCRIYSISVLLTPEETF